MSSWPWMQGVDEAITSQPIDPVTAQDVRPLVTDLIQKHRQKIDKVKAELQNDPLYDATKHDDLWILRFLMTHKKSKPAIQAAKTTLLLRKKYNLDDTDIRSTPPHKNTQPPLDNYAKHFNVDCARFTVPDRRRGVVGFVNLTAMDYKPMLKNITVEEWNLAYMYVAEWTHQWLDYITRTTGRMTKSVRLVSIEGLGITSLPREGMRRDGDAMALTEDAYPQMLETIYICFPPLIFHLIWKMARPFLPKRVCDKMDIINPLKNENERCRLYQHISQENLPEAFGGSRAHYLDWDESDE